MKTLSDSLVSQIDCSRNTSMSTRCLSRPPRGSGLRASSGRCQCPSHPDTCGSWAQASPDLVEVKQANLKTSKTETTKRYTNTATTAFVAHTPGGKAKGVGAETHDDCRLSQKVAPLTTHHNVASLLHHKPFQDLAVLLDQVLDIGLFLQNHMATKTSSSVAGGGVSARMAGIAIRHSLPARDHGRMPVGVRRLCPIACTARVL